MMPPRTSHHMANPARFCADLLLIVVVATLLSAFPCSAATTILNVMVEGQVPPEEANIALGVQAAAKEFGITISSVSLPANYANLPSAIVSAAKAASAAAVFGMYDDQGASAIMTTTNFGDLVLFGPYTQASTLRQFNENIYFMSADPTAEFQALLKQAIVRYSEGYFALGSVGWMFLTGGVDDDTVMLNALTTQMANLGCNPPIVYHQAADSTFSTATFNTYMSSPPTSMFVFGQRGTHTSAFFTALVTSAEVISAPNFYVVAPFALIQSLSDAYTAITASKLASTSLWFTSPIPLPSDTRFAAAATFATQIKNIGVTTPVASLPILFSYFGWISGQQLNYILNHYNLEGGTNYAAIKSNVFMQNRYLIGTDIVLGDYGGVCANSVTATRLGGTCNCNSGGRYVAIITLTFGGAQVTVTKETETFIPLDQCFSSSATLAAASAPVALPIHGAVVDITSDTSLTDVSSQVLAAQKASSTYAPSGATTTLAVQSVSATSTTTVNTAISAASRQSPLSVVSGPLPFAAFQTTVGQVVMEPVVAPVDEMPSNASNTLYLSATFPQQIMYIAQHLSSVITSATATTATNRIHLRTRTQTSEELIFFTNRALSNYKLQLSSAYGVGATIASITSTMPTSGYIFVCGMTSADVAPLITFLAANSGATVILSLDTITVFYAALTAAIGTQTAVMKQIWFATNIPLWTQTGSSNSVQKYITTLGASARTPSAVRGLLASLAVYAGTALSTNVTTNGFLASWYQQQFLTVDGATYGPYWRNCVVFPPGVERPCVMNYGARQVSVYAWSSVSDTSTASLAAATTTPITLGTPMNFLAESTTATTTTTSTPSTSTTTTSTTTTTTTLSPCAITTTTSKPIEYTTKPPTTTVAPTSSPSKHTKSTVWKYFVVALEFVVILAACCLIYHILFVADRSASRDPPTDTDAPTSILVIEVDGWKAIHEAVPEQATRCIRKYRARVLNLVARSPCYIARVVDDLYMIVSVNPIDVMNLAKQLQVDMHKMRGEDVEAIESVYNSRGMGPSAIPGLRLRMGIHTEPVDIIFNVATGLYEYYGAGCRIAARTERCAQGGQILLTSAACNSLSEAQLATLNIISLGQRVFPEQSVDLFEMEAVRDRIIGTLSSNAANLSPSDPILTMCDGSTTPAATMVAHEVLTVMHNMLPIGERIKLLRAKCELCGFPPLQSKGFMSKEEYADALIGQLADSAGRAAESSLAPLLSTGQAHKSLSDDRYNSAKAKPTFTKSDSLSSVTQNDTAKTKSDPYDLESQQSDGGN